QAGGSGLPGQAEAEGPLRRQLNEVKRPRDLPGVFSCLRFVLAYLDSCLTQKQETRLVSVRLLVQNMSNTGIDDRFSALLTMLVGTDQHGSVSCSTAPSRIVDGIRFGVDSRSTAARGFQSEPDLLRGVVAVRHADRSTVVPVAQDPPVLDDQRPHRESGAGGSLGPGPCHLH